MKTKMIEKHLLAFDIGINLEVTKRKKYG